MTVRETLDFSARCQGVGSRTEIMEEVTRREKLAGIVPESDIDTYMKAISVAGLERSLQTDYILKILGLDICADTMVGDAMRRGISGGQQKRLTTGEMIVGPTKALFMDDISTGLDSSTTFQIVTCLQQLVHISEATMLVSLLQPAPETYDLFDDVILMAEGKTVYHGPRNCILEFFEDCGFRCPKRKGAADFLQEVISRKDQEQYWYRTDQPYTYISVDELSKKFREFHVGKKLDEELSESYDKSQSHRNALSFSIYSLTNRELFKACMARELLLMKRNSFVYIFKCTQLTIVACITMTVFLRTRMGVDLVHANYYMGSLFFALIILMVNGFPELAMTVSRLPVFYKQRDFYFYPAWAYAVPASILKIPISLVESFIWTSLTYYVIGYSPEVGRFFCHFFLLFNVHLMSLSLFRFIASLFQTAVAATTGGTLILFLILSFGGFIPPRNSIPAWLRWGLWMSPLTYGEIGITVNEFLAPRWEKLSSSNTTIGHEVLTSRALDYKGRMVLPFDPLTITFQEVQYYVDTPLEMREQGITEKNLQLLRYITGTFRPGVLTALMGVSGAGKTTLMDVLSGRKTGGTIEGDIRIGGYPKVQETFARISGYCEQTDIHSPQITVEESVIYSAWLRLPPQIDPSTRAEFVNEVLETIELDGIKDALVGIPGVSGLSTEQRKRLTIAVELVSNPSIIFMDEPTSGLDARAAAIVMRAIKNVVQTGRTVVCTIHQPSIDLFEAFDESIPGVPKIKDNYNPATWMLDVTSTSAEIQLGIDFAQIYRESSLYQHNEEMAKQLSIPAQNSKDLHFETRFPQNNWVQFKACLWKQHLSYWRSPSYNLVRFTFILATSTTFGALYWKHGKKVDNQQDLFNILGAMFAAMVFLGINNCSSVLPFVSTERNVLYREKFAGMYTSWSYSFAQVASILASSCYTLLNLFSGFLVPGPQIPNWWIWLFYGCPSSWTLNGLFTSQFGDVEKRIEVFGETKSVASFLKDYFGFHHDRLWVVAVVLALYPLAFAFLFGLCIGKLNFQRR
ncbi:Pleiotropic drug resistance protein 3 [Acorus calamus]|uniref:Pleiotropic drug resistance protein 3 n=1 Tax=Acorus calamus TaxID=4465 RepID=A0AAV9F1K9_ACOCL|nr:Pleiotropic drug resistance protein 3 [Acorus calamus]